MTPWAQGTTRGARTTKADTLEHDNYLCQLRLDGCTRWAATTITTNRGKQQSICPHCLEHLGEQPKMPRKPRNEPRDDSNRHPPGSTSRPVSFRADWA